MTAPASNPASRKTATRQSIVDAAICIARKGGWESVTMRRIADQIGASRNKPYGYFESKDAILLEISRQAISDWAGRIIGKAELKPSERFRYGAEEWWDFAIKDPVVYDLAFVRRLSNVESQEKREAHDITIGAADVAKKIKPELSDEQAVDAIVRYHALVHGFIQLALGGRIYGSDPEPMESAKASMLRAVDGWLEAL